ncbi:heat-shock protein Hsp20 [Planotetraspora thailandica]|uniref:Heat-shock protein Hsp20 n=1 Tax=Planotetraspora thailandica TaxID=487172 RepID=A0A8J3UYW1_9ACTN|nr:Hsp20/alpha crystallin family protein [Planotetraspora thailandica]GII52377.1 heat-shock protein Hsp20 [Planotetraspora thailandica]
MSSLTLWTRNDPFSDFDRLVRRAFGPHFAPATSLGTIRTTGFTPAAEVTRDGDDAVVRVELPGIDVEKDVAVEVDRGRLVVRGERRDERSEEHDGRTLREVRYGSFQRSFALPAHVTADAVTASYEAGVLSLRVTGAHAGAQPQRIAVTSGGEDGKQIDA